MQFRQEFPCILQAVWVVDLSEGPIRVSKIDVMDAYHRRSLRPSQMGAFVFVVP